MPSILRLTTAIGLLLAVATRAPAQAPASSPDALGLRPGRTVRVAVPGEGRLSGNVTAVSGTGFSFATANGPRSFASLPDTLWTRERAVVPGAIGGGIVGIAGGILLGLVANALCEYDCGGAGGYAIAGGLAGGAAGAALGSLVGAAVPRWKRRVP